MNTNLRTVLTPAAATQSEHTDYSSAKITNGYGLVSKAGVSVQKGITAHLNVDLKVKTLTVNDVTTWLNENKSSFSEEGWSSVSKSKSTAGAFGWLVGKNDKEFSNTSGKIDASSDQKVQGALKTLHQQQETELQIQGTLDAVGTSFIPTEGYVFVEVTTITFNDNTSMHVINTDNSAVADGSGNTNGLKKTGGQLALNPIGS